MPAEDYYASCRTLPDQLNAIADWHSAPDVRHISQYETEVLHLAAAVLESIGEMAQYNPRYKRLVTRNKLA